MYFQSELLLAVPTSTEYLLSARSVALSRRSIYFHRVSTLIEGSTSSEILSICACVFVCVCVCVCVWGHGRGPGRWGVSFSFILIPTAVVGISDPSQQISPADFKSTVRGTQQIVNGHQAKFRCLSYPPQWTYEWCVHDISIRKCTLHSAV